MILVDKITVVFADQSHHRLHQVLMAFGFSFEITPPDYKAGLLYRHPSKQLEVELSISEDEYRAVTHDLKKELGERIPTEESYTAFEWEWMDDATDEAEYLRRELHILVHVRPHSLTQIPTKGK
jgi:hypothetical protein